MIVFDMAGTTIDENNIVYKTLQKSLNEFGVEVSLEQVLAIGAGKEKLNAIQDVIKLYGNDEDMLKASQIFITFKKYLETAYEIFDLKPMSGAALVLQELRKNNILVVLNTGYDRTTAKFILEKIKWEQSYHYDLLVTASDVTKSRPSPDMIQFAMNSCGVTNSKNVIKIGDSQIDIEEGRNANCLYSIGITTGAQTKEQLLHSNPDYVIDNLNDLYNILNF